MRSRTTLFAAALGAALAAGAARAQEPARDEAWRITVLPQSSLVFARDGSLIGEIGKEWRTSVPLRTLPAYVSQAFVAVEDQRFYQHNGVDLVGVAGAIKDNLTGSARGASTITQQLVGNLHPDIIDRTDRSGLSGLERKLREQSAAREMEKHYNKEQILEAYINDINFGHGWYGIEAAARHYFGKPAAQLTLAEAATLAALPKGPAIYDPIKHPDRAKKRRDVVLALMAEQKYITPAQAANAQKVAVHVAPNAGMSVRAPYFIDAVRANLEKNGVTGVEAGLRIYTTIDPALQGAAERALTAGIAAVEARPDYKHPTAARNPRNAPLLQGAMVALEPQSGDVLALVGGRNYATSPFNRAVNGLRQPGSAFKPFVYAAAIRDSIAPNSMQADTALTISYDRQVYSPRNADGAFLGPITLRNALAHSRNPVAVQLWEHVGADSVIALARRAGIRTDIAPFPASAIGASAVQPLNLVAAYTTFANLGDAVEPRLVVRVEDVNGRAVWSSGVVQRTGVIDSATAFIVRDMMRDAAAFGTGTAARNRLPAEIPLAGKTGTTDDVTDVWFVGMTPDVVAGVWLGFDKPGTIIAGAAGGMLAAPIFGDAIAKWYKDREAGSWSIPGGLIVATLDRDSGALATRATPADRRYAEYFLPGTEPDSLRLGVRRLVTWGPASH